MMKAEGGKTKDEALRQRVLEDAESLDEAERLLPVVRRLQQWTAPEPTIQQTNSLIARLQAEMPTTRHRPSAIRKLQSASLLLRAQLRVVRREIWLASLLIIALGALVTLSVYGPESAGSALPLVIIAPLVAAIGVAFIYGPFVDPALEIELATPVSPRLVLMARLVLVFGFDLALGLTASVALIALRSDLSFWPLVMAWLAPMAFLSALAFLLTMLTTEPLWGMLVSLVLWSVQALQQVAVIGRVLWYVPNLMTSEAHPWLLMSALALAGLAVWLGGREERWIGQST